MRINPRYQNTLSTIRTDLACALDDPKFEKVIVDMHFLAAAGATIKAAVDSIGFSVCARYNGNTAATVRGLDFHRAVKLYSSLCVVHPIRGKGTRPVTDSDISRAEAAIKLIVDKSNNN